MTQAGTSGLKAALLACLLAILAACTTPNLERGKELATAGRVASESLRTQAEAVAHDYRLNADRSAALMLLGQAASDAGGDLRPPRTDAAAFDRVGGLLLARADVLEHLESLYGALEAGLGFDANGQARAAFADFAQSVDGYRAALDAASAPVADTPAAGAAGVLLGRFAEAMQARKMGEASAVIREQLDAVEALLRREQQYAASIRVTNALLRGTLSEALQQSELVDPYPELDDLTALAGVERADGASAALRGNARLWEALKLFRAWQSQRRQADVGADYVRSLAVLSALRAQHVAFEAGEPLGFGALRADVEELLALAARQ